MEDFFENRPKLNLFEKIALWWKFDGRYWYKNLKHGIKNLWYWAPVIWKDRNWDQHFIYEVLKHKLKVQAKYIGDRDWHTRAQLDAKRMRLCVKLIQLVQDETYRMEYMDYHKNKVWFDRLKSMPDHFEMKSENVWENYNDYFKKYPLIYKRVINGEGIFKFDNVVDVESKERIAMNIAYINQDRAHKLLFKILQENIDGWWD